MAGRRTLWYHLATGILLAGIFTYQMAHVTGPVLYPDEFGYFANAAAWLGFDWSDTVSLQSYYSYGYSIVLLPILKLISSPLWVYKAAVLLNCLFVALHAALLWKITCALKEGEESADMLYCLMAAFYPSLIFYMQLTLAESLLSLLFVSGVWALVRYSQKGKIKDAAVFFIVLAGSYLVHMRTVGILAAGIVAFAAAFWKRNQRNRKAPAALAALAALLLLILTGGGFMKAFLQDGLYQGVSKGQLNTNDYGGQLVKLAYILSREGIADFLVSCAGKLLYLGISTLGTFYFGLWHIWKRAKKEPVCLFLLAAALFSFAVTAVYMVWGGRGDAYLYGRYNETVVPVLICLGLMEMSRSKRLFCTMAVLAFFQALAACMIAGLLHGSNPVEYQGYFTVGLSGYLPKEFMHAPEEYILYPAALGTAAMLLLAVVQGLLARKKKALALYLALFIGFYIYTGVSAGDKYLYDHSADSREDMEAACRMKGMLRPEDEAVFYLSDSDAHYVDIVQFCLREHPLRIKEELPEEAGKAECAITYRNAPGQEALQEAYGELMETYHFRFYYGRKYGK